MKPDKFARALTLRAAAAITRNDAGVYAVPSLTSERVYLVTESGCSCPSFKFPCSHALACFRAIYPILQFRWATSYEWLRAAGEHYRPLIEAMPERLKAECRKEYCDAISRLRGDITRPASKYVSSSRDGVSVIERRMEPQRIGSMEV